MLPGFVLGGNTIAAIYRFTDGGFEPLMALCCAGVIWTAAAYIFFKTTSSIKSPSRIYYPATAAAAILFTIAVGCAVIFCGNGTFSAAVGLIASATAFAAAAQGFVSSQYTTGDRGSFIAGAIGSAAIWSFAMFYSRLAWMETLFFYMAVFLLLAWAFASPLSCRGSKKRQRVWRILLLFCAVGSFYTVPVFSPPPGTADAEKMWVKTHTTANGRKFILMEKSGKSSFYAPDGSFIMSNVHDENSSGAALALLSLQNKEKPQIQLVAPATSVLPGILRAIMPVKLHHCRLPESMHIKRFNWKKPNFSVFLPQYPQTDPGDFTADILLITALPENKYPPFLRNFLDAFCSNIALNGMAALPGYLLQNPTVFRFMHEKFPYSSILPVPGAWWVFSRKPLDTSLKNISQNLHSAFQYETGISADMIEVIFSNRNLWGHTPVPAYKPAPSYGSNTLLGSWWWILIGLGAATVWRIIRLFSERRNTMYAYFNAVENGFSGMGTFLLILSLLLVNNGATMLFLAMLTTAFALFLSKNKFGGVWASLAGLLLLLWIIISNINGSLYEMIILLQAVLLTGAMASVNSPDCRTERKMLCGVFLGMLLGALAITVFWLYNIPILLIWAMIFAARVPGIWQYARKSVYYRE